MMLYTVVCILRSSLSINNNKFKKSIFCRHFPRSRLSLYARILLKAFSLTIPFLIELHRVCCILSTLKLCSTHSTSHPTTYRQALLEQFRSSTRCTTRQLSYFVEKKNVITVFLFRIIVVVTRIILK